MREFLLEQIRVGSFGMIYHDVFWYELYLGQV